MQRIPSYVPFLTGQVDGIERPERLYPIMRGGSAHRRISRKFQQQRGHFDMVWNLATNAVLISIDWYVHMSGLKL